MKPAQVLECQADLHRRLTTSESMGSAVASQFRLSDSDGISMVRGMAHQLELADAYRVTDEMSMLVQFAASKLDDSDTVDRTMVPSPWGFVRFDRPLPVREARGRQMLAHFMTWGPATVPGKGTFGGGMVERHGLMVSWWNDMFDEPDEVARLLLDGRPPRQRAAVSREFGRWGFVGAEVVRDGTRLGAPNTALTMEQQAQIIAEGDSPADEITNTTRYTHALFLLLNQTIVSMREEEVPRAAAKRIGRMPIPGRISVITLRRTSGSRSEGESAVQWSHRWLVKGHWRWQPTGPGRKERVRIWINGYVKGPEDKPFVATDKVYQLSR